MFLSTAVGDDYADAVAEIGFFPFCCNDSILVCTEGTHLARQAFLHEHSCPHSALGSALIVSVGPAGTGKTETLKDISDELIRPTIVGDGSTFDDLVSQCKRIQAGLPGVIIVFDELKISDVKTFSLLTAPTSVCVDESPQQHLRSLVGVTFGTSWDKDENQNLVAITAKSSVKLDALWGVLGMPKEASLGRLGRDAWDCTNVASIVELAAPSFSRIIDAMCTSEGLELKDAGTIFELLSGFEAGARHLHLKDQDLHKVGTTPVGGEDGTASLLRVLSERPRKNGEIDFGMRTLRGWAARAGLAQRTSCVPKDAAAALSFSIAATPEQFANRAFPDRNRAPEEETLLSLAIASGDTALVRCAIDARDRACLWRKNCNMHLAEAYGGRLNARPFIAMDVALLCVYYPKQALEVLARDSPFLVK
jgi:hypothetical protein